MPAPFVLTATAWGKAQLLLSNCLFAGQPDETWEGSRGQRLDRHQHERRLENHFSTDE